MRLLLAEDDKYLSRAINAILVKNHYSVDTVFDGEEALAYLDCGNYDGVILDLMMPKLDGISVLRQMRAAGSRLPVLILTALSDVDDKVLGLDSGANDYLTKPFDAKELLARIRAMTRDGTSSADHLLHAGNITLDTATFRLSSPSGSFRLANKEYQVMELLMRSKPGLLSTETLMCRIWGYDSDTDISVVWVYISYLRKKLDALHANIQIRAIRNTGYTLEERI